MVNMWVNVMPFKQNMLLQKKMCSNADKWKLTAKFSQLKVPALWRCIKYPAEWLIGTKINKGEDVRFTVTSKLSDPDAYGAERVVLRNVSFDDLTVADWKVGTKGNITAPFTFTKYEFLDTIEAV